MKKILIVDDEPTNIALIKGAMRDIECEISVAVDGEDGLKKAKEIVPDLVILDVMMPKMDGFKVCGLLKSNQKFFKVVVLILSSRAGDDDIEISLKVGADGYMLKPVDQDKLNSKVKELLGVAV